MPRLERDYQLVLMEKIESKFPGCQIFNLTPLRILGIPDLLLLYENHWAMLETKRAIGSHRQALQEHYIALFDDMSFARFIDPSTEREILNELQRSFST